MKITKINMLLSAVILLQALLLIAGTATAVNNKDLDRSIIINGSAETVIARTGEISNQSAGGYITQIDIYPQYNQTQNWQGFYGNVSGNISLSGPGGTEMYNWSVNVTNKSVYATTDAVFINWTTFYNANITNLDKLWFQSEMMADTVANTYKTQDGNRTFVNTSLDAWGVNTTHGFENHVITSVAENAIGTKNDTLWAAVVTDPQTNYKGGLSNYELLVPVTNGAADIYYFYIEIP